MDNLKNFIKLLRRILFICIIVTTMGILLSCSLQKSVRMGSYNSNKRTKSTFAYNEQKSPNKSENKSKVDKENSHITNKESNTSPFLAYELPVTGEDGESSNYQKTDLDYQDLFQQKIAKLEEEISYLRKEIGLLYQLIEEQNSQSSVERNEKSKESSKNIKSQKSELKSNANQKKQSNINRPKIQKAILNPTTEAKANESKKTQDLQKIHTNTTLEQILSLIKDKRYDEALSTIEKQLQVENELGILSNLWYWQGEALFMKKEYQKALECFRKVLSFPKSSKRTESQIMLAECYTRLGKLSEAKREYQKFIEEFPFSEFAPRAKRMLQQL